MKRIVFVVGVISTLCGNFVVASQNSDNLHIEVKDILSPATYQGEVGMYWGSPCGTLVTYEGFTGKKVDYAPGAWTITRRKVHLGPVVGGDELLEAVRQVKDDETKGLVLKTIEYLITDHHATNGKKKVTLTEYISKVVDKDLVKQTVEDKDI